jgi:hypothetical protein
MPRFDTEVDVEVEDFYNSCSKSEKKEIAELVIDDELANPLDDDVAEVKSMGIQHDNYIESLNKLSSLYFSLSLEEIEKIIELSKKY